MWIIFLLVGVNIIIILSIIYVVGCSDYSPKFQISDNEYKINRTKLTDEENSNMSPYDYYTSLRHKSWDGLSEYEKERMILAAHLILDDCGTVSTLSEIETFLTNRLPDNPKSYPGGDGVLGGFREWQKNR